MARVPYDKYRRYHGETVIKLMAKGKTNHELASHFNISYDTLLDWRKRYPEFQEAFDIGFSKRKAFYADEARKCWLAGKDKGFKYFAALAGQELEFQTVPQGQSTNNQININHLNILDSKSDVDLIQLIQEKLQRLPIDVKLIESKDNE